MELILLLLFFETQHAVQTTIFKQTFSPPSRRSLIPTWDRKESNWNLSVDQSASLSAVALPERQPFFFPAAQCFRPMIYHSLFSSFLSFFHLFFSLITRHYKEWKSIFALKQRRCQTVCKRPLLRVHLIDQ